MRKMLWIGDAVVSSGFARATHYILDTLHKHYEVDVLGLNYQGDPHDYPYKIYPCWPGGDLFGVNRVTDFTKSKEYDVIVIQNDPWNFPEYLNKVVRGTDTKVVGIVAVDGKNCRGTALNELDLAIFWTEFGRNEAREGGYTKPAAVIPLGVDRSIYYPEDRIAARQMLGLPEKLHDKFIVGNINRNQPRKRLDLMVMYFAEWVKSTSPVRDAYLYLHASPTGEESCDIPQLMKYYGLQKRLIQCIPPLGSGAPEEHLRHTYNAFDVMMTTTQGEGFGLTTLEGMACGVPQILPKWAALGDLFSEHAFSVDCDHFACTPNGINAIGGLPNKEQAIRFLNFAYERPDCLKNYANKALECASSPAYNWRNIGRRYLDVLGDL